MKIKIPFNEWSKERFRKGMKTATSRTKKYGKPGDWFEVDGVRYEILDHYRLTLRQVKAEYWRAEGCTTPSEFRKVWCEIHPRAGWTPDKYVWLHEFRRIKP